MCQFWDNVGPNEYDSKSIMFLLCSVAAEEMSCVATKDKSSVVGEDMSSVATEEMSSVATEEMSSVAAIKALVSHIGGRVR